jgi:hypothetical protein
MEMSARFAGSQRVGDRRRRRLAVEADGGGDHSNLRQDILAPVGQTRLVDRPHVDTAPAAELTAAQFPITQIIPIERWKYAVAGVAVLTLSGGLAVAGWLATNLSGAAGPAIARILAPVNGPATKWFSSLLLVLSAQLAVLIWWARSQSLKDFEGRYWLWTRAAAIWLAFSGCIALDVGQAAVDVLRHFRPNLSLGYSALAWLIPACTIGFSIARGLYREMSGCRASRVLFGTAMACYVVAAGCDLGAASALETQIQALLVQVGLLTGHASLFFSMWVHARHVVHCSPDPAQSKKSKWRIPRPHFPMPKFLAFKRRQLPDAIDTTETQTESSKSPRSRKREPVSVEPAAPSDGAPVQQPQNAPPASDVLSKPRYRIDARHNEPVELKEVAAPRDESPAEGPPESEQARDSDDLHSRPDLRGMSKKQRRRIMQELRDRERAAARGE